MLQFPHLFYDMVHMKEVAEQCGFCDYSVFYQAFMKEYGISPRSFRTREKELPFYKSVSNAQTLIIIRFYHFYTFSIHFSLMGSLFFDKLSCNLLDLNFEKAISLGR